MICQSQSLSHVQIFATLWTIACQTPLFIGFFRQECCSRLPLPSPEDLPHTRTEPGSLALQADSLPSEPPGKPYDKATKIFNVFMSDDLESNSSWVIGNNF